MPTTLNVDDFIEDKSPARCETEPDLLVAPSGPSRKVGAGMPMCFGIQKGINVKKVTSNKLEGEDPILALLK